jgi:pimeloyl-ACP methyl ester carboxylesterase
MSTLGESHYPLDEMKWVGDNHWMRGSRVLLARVASPQTTVVFVHGWGGTAGDSWEAFPRALRFMPNASHADVFLFGYPSLQHSAEFCAAMFRKFLEDVLREPSATVVNPSLPHGAEPRADTAKYKHVLLVAHSMGAVVVRRAFLDLERHLKDRERRSVRLLFFAPAHRGSSLPLLVSSGFGLGWLPGSALVGSLLTVHYRSLQDLAVGSGFLTKLEADSGAARAALTGASELATDAHLRAHVYHAQGDKVVVQDRFDDDHPMEPIMRKNHREICKPSDAYQEPVAALRSIL